MRVRTNETHFRAFRVQFSTFKEKKDFLNKNFEVTFNLTIKDLWLKLEIYLCDDKQNENHYYEKNLCSVLTSFFLLYAFLYLSLKK